MSWNFKQFGIYSDGINVRVIVELKPYTITGYQFKIEEIESSIIKTNKSGMTNKNINFFLYYGGIPSFNLFSRTSLLSPEAMNDYAYLGQVNEDTKERLIKCFNKHMEFRN